ncbi:hypothetical protein [Legionella antarctica]|nr:hypothetical protein [Legionella antarctica]
MTNFLRDVDAYFRSKPRLFFSILGGLTLFLIATIVLSVVCPPAVLAIGIGAWSLVGNILPLIAINLFATFTLCTLTTQIPRMFRSPIDEIEDLLGDLISLAGQMAKVDREKSTAQPENQETENLSEVVHHDPLFVSTNKVEKNQTEDQLQTSNVPSINKSNTIN